MNQKKENKILSIIEYKFLKGLISIKGNMFNKRINTYAFA